jgi:hypothetical protein
MSQETVLCTCAPGGSIWYWNAGKDYIISFFFFGGSTLHRNAGEDYVNVFFLFITTSFFNYCNNFTVRKNFGRSCRTTFNPSPTSTGTHLSTGHTLSQSRKGSNSNSARQPVDSRRVVDTIGTFPQQWLGGYKNICSIGNGYKGHSWGHYSVSPSSA